MSKQKNLLLLLYAIQYGTKEMIRVLNEKTIATTHNGVKRKKKPRRHCHRTRAYFYEMNEIKQNKDSR